MKSAFVFALAIVSALAGVQLASAQEDGGSAPPNSDPRERQLTPEEVELLLFQRGFVARNTAQADEAGKAAPKPEFFLKPGKTQIELLRGTWRSLIIPSKDFDYGSSLLVESPEDGAVSISGRIMTSQALGAAKTESFEAGEAGEKYAADIWTIKGLRPGIASIRLLGDNDQEYEIEVTVKGDTRYLDAMLARFHPKAKIEAVEIADSSVVLRGEVSSIEESMQVRELAEQLYASVLIRLKVPQPDVGSEGAAPEANIDPDDFVGSIHKNEAVDPSPFQVQVPEEAARATPVDTAPVEVLQDIPESVNRVEELSPYSHTAEGVSEAVGAANIEYRAASAPPKGPTTQVRILHFGGISMKTPGADGSPTEINWGNTVSSGRSENGFRSLPCMAHRQNFPQGSQTRLKFRTEQFRDDVWVTGLLLTSSASDKTRHHLQHFPVDLEIQNHEIVQAAGGKLITRIVVLESPARIESSKGQDEELRPKSFSGPDSFEKAVYASTTQGPLLAVLILGPESLLQRRFTLPGQAAAGGDTGVDAVGPRFDPYTRAERAAVESPFRPPKPGSAFGPQPAQPGSDPESVGPNRRAVNPISHEMRQLRHEVRALREQLGRLVEVLSRDSATIPDPGVGPKPSAPIDRLEPDDPPAIEAPGLTPPPRLDPGGGTPDLFDSASGDVSRKPKSRRPVPFDSPSDDSLPSPGAFDSSDDDAKTIRKPQPAGTPVDPQPIR